MEEEEKGERAGQSKGKVRERRTRRELSRRLRISGVGVRRRRRRSLVGGSMRRRRRKG